MSGHRQRRVRRHVSSAHFLRCHEGMQWIRFNRLRNQIKPAVDLMTPSRLIAEQPVNARISLFILKALSSRTQECNGKSDNNRTHTMTHHNRLTNNVPAIFQAENWPRESVRRSGEFTQSGLNEILRILPSNI